MRTPWIQRLKSGKRKWAVRWIDPATGKQKQKRASSKDASIKLQREISERLARSVHQGPPKDWRDFYDEYMRYYASKNPDSKRSYKEAKNVLKAFAKQTGIESVGEITPRLLNDYVATRHKTVRPATIKKELGVVRAALNYAKGMQYLEHNPVESPALSMPKVVNQEKPILDRGQCARLIEAAGKEGHLFQTIVWLFCETGMRSGEVSHLEPSDFEFHKSGATISIKCKKEWAPKGRYDRCVEIGRELADRIKEVTNGSPYVFVGNETYQGHNGFARKIVKQLKTACKNAKLPTVKPHDLRRAAASDMIVSGVGENLVMQALGWKSSNTLRQFYLRLDGRTAARRAREIRDFKVSLPESRDKRMTERMGQTQGVA